MITVLLMWGRIGVTVSALSWPVGPAPIRQAQGERILKPIYARHFVEMILDCDVLVIPGKDPGSIPLNLKRWLHL